MRAGRDQILAHNPSGSKRRLIPAIGVDMNDQPPDCLNRQRCHCGLHLSRLKVPMQRLVYQVVGVRKLFRRQEVLRNAVSNAFAEIGPRPTRRRNPTVANNDRLIVLALYRRSWWISRPIGRRRHGIGLVFQRTRIHQVVALRRQRRVTKRLTVTIKIRCTGRLPRLATLACSIVCVGFIWVRQSDSP